MEEFFRWTADRHHFVQYPGWKNDECVMYRFDINESGIRVELAKRVKTEGASGKMLRLSIEVIDATDHPMHVGTRAGRDVRVDMRCIEGSIAVGDHFDFVSGRLEWRHVQIRHEAGSDRHETAFDLWPQRAEVGESVRNSEGWIEF